MKIIQKEFNVPDHCNIEKCMAFEPSRQPLYLNEIQVKLYCYCANADACTAAIEACREETK